MLGRCAFCQPAGIIVREELVFAVWDAHPVTKGHALIVPHRHAPSYFDCTAAEKAALWRMVDQLKLLIDAQFAPQGYNLGVNIGEPAGQTISHAHVHVIPRYRGDTPKPRGGVRGVIPDRQSY